MHRFLKLNLLIIYFNEFKKSTHVRDYLQKLEIQQQPHIQEQNQLNVAKTSLWQTEFMPTASVNNREILSIDSLIINNLYVNKWIEARITKISRIIPSNFKGKHDFFYIDLADNSDNVRALFYIGNSTKDTMAGFYDDVRLDDILLFNGFQIQKAESTSKLINPKIQLIFNKIAYEKVVKIVKTLSLKSFPIGFYHGQIFCKVFII